ncbi:MAG: DUF4836 family protein [Sphingobacteriia bacterium]|nr:DUF4836 family protein [Sphingobacteriia bacterium]
MTTRFHHLVLAVLFAGTLISCKNNAPEETRLIPSEALAVVTIDPNALSEKLQNGGISIDSVLGKIFEKDSADTKERKTVDAFRKNAGFDWTKPIHYFVVRKAAPDKTDISIMTVLASLSDTAKLVTFIQSGEHTNSGSVLREKLFSYIEQGPRNLIAWNDKHVIAMFYQHQVKPYYDTAKMKFVIPERPDYSKEMLAEAVKMFSQKEKASMRSVEGFSEMFKTKAEGYLFSTTDNLLGSFSAIPLQLPTLEELLKGNHTAATLAFEDGRIIARSTTYTNKALGNILKKYAGPTVNLSLIDHYPSQKINGIMLAAFNPEIFGGLLKQLEVEGLVNEFMKKSAISSQELYGSLKGDIAVVVSDLGMANTEPQERDDELSLVKRKPVGKMIMNVPVGNKESFRKVMDKAVAMGTIQKIGNTYKGSDLIRTLGFYLQANDQQLIISSDSLTCQQYLQGTAKTTISKEVRDHLSGKSTAFYFDIANTINAFIKDSTSGYYRSMVTAKNTVKDLRGSSDNFSNGKIKAVVELRMQNEKQNSLVTLTSLFTNIAVDARQVARREREMEEKMFPSGIPAVIRAN